MTTESNMVLCSLQDCNNNVYCKTVCRKHYNKKYRLDNLEKSRQYNVLYKRQNKNLVKTYDKSYSESDKGRFAKAKSKAKTRGLDFSLSFDLFLKISKQPCYYCNDELCGKESFQGSHLDRLDNSIGYVENNVVSCGKLCNQIRMNNLTPEETKVAIKAVISFRKQNKWYVYLIQSTKDNTIYTGITKNVEARLKTHNEGRGARYTRGRGPFIIVKSFEVDSKSEALKLEYKIKQLSKQEKLNFKL